VSYHLEPVVRRVGTAVERPRTVGNLSGVERQLVDEYRAAMKVAREGHKKARAEGNLMWGMATEADLHDEAVRLPSSYNAPRALVRVLDFLDRIVIPTWEAWPGEVRAVMGSSPMFDDVMVLWRLAHDGCTYSRELGIHAPHYAEKPWSYLQTDLGRTVDSFRESCLAAADPLVLKMPAREYDE